MTTHAATLPLRTGARPVHAVEAAWFVALVIAAGWSCVLVLGASVPILALTMWLPGIVTIVLVRASGGRVTAALGLDRVGWADGYLLAYWLPVVFCAGTVGLTVALGLGRLDPGLGGDGLVGQVVSALTLAPILNGLVMLGSEIGWRAYLLPRLLGLGPWRAIALTSVLWWLWQLPLTAGPLPLPWTADGASQAAWCLLVGAILGWLYVRTRSVWAPALFAGAIGATASLPPLLLRDVAAVAAPMGPLALALPLLAVIAMRSRRFPASAE